MDCEKINEWKLKHGLFKSFEDLIESKVVSTKTLTKVFEANVGAPDDFDIPFDNQFYQYLSEDVSEDVHEDESALTSPLLAESIPKKIEEKDKISQNELTLLMQSLIQPRFTLNNNIRTFVSLHLDERTFSWTSFNLSQENNQQTVNINQWKCENLHNQKQSVYDLLNDIEKIVNQIPKSDVYIIENPPQRARAGLTTKQLSDSIFFNRRLMSIILMLKHHRSNESTTNISIAENFYFMEYNTMGRLYGLVIGNEIVSTQEKTLEILKLAANNYHDYVSIAPEQFETFKQLSRIDREVISKTMLIGLTFFKTAIQLCPASILALRKRKKISKKS